MIDADLLVVEERAGTEEDERRRWLAVTLIAAASFVIMMVGIGSDELAADETWTYELSRASWSSFWTQIHQTEAPIALYYVLVKLWSGVGTSEGVLRLPSAVLVAATVPVVYVIGRRLGGARVGLLACLLVATNAFLLGYGQTARAYSLVVLLGSASTALFLRVLEDRPPRWVLPAWVICSALAVYAHFFAVFVLGAQLLTLVTFSPTRDLRHRLRNGVVASLVLVAPLAVWILATSMPPFADERAECEDCVAPGAAEFGRFLTGIAGDGGEALLGVGLIAIVLAVVGGTLRVASRPERRESTRPTTASIAWLLVLWIALPLVLATLLSHLVTPVAERRYFVIGVVPFDLLVAFGICRIRRPVLRGLAIAVVLGLSAAAIVTQHRRENDEDYRAAAEVITDAAAPGDHLLFDDGYLRFTTRKYLLERDGDELLEPLRPAAPLEELTIDAYPDEPDHAGEDEAFDARDLEGERVWLVCRVDDADCVPEGSDLEYEDHRYEVEQTTMVRGLRVSLLTA